MVAASPAAVYAVAADPDNLPRWASGLARGEVRRDGDALVVDSPMGRVTVTFVPRNALGVLDHEVRLPSGEVVTNPMRVVAHYYSRGSSLLRDLALLVWRDLEALGRLVEGGA